MYALSPLRNGYICMIWVLPEPHYIQQVIKNHVTRKKNRCIECVIRLSQWGWIFCFSLLGVLSMLTLGSLLEQEFDQLF